MSTQVLLSLVSVTVILLTNFAMVVRMYVRVGDYEKWREAVDRHVSDREVHIDPRRDTERWSELTKRLDKMDKKIDNLLTLERENNVRKSKGDSEDA